MKKRPLRIYRARIRKSGPPDLPWVVKCGCGYRARCRTFEWAVRSYRGHDCDGPL